LVCYTGGSFAKSCVFETGIFDGAKNEKPDHRAGAGDAGGGLLASGRDATGKSGAIPALPPQL